MSIGHASNARAQQRPRTRPRGRPRDPRLDAAILAAAEEQLTHQGYARMSMESVAAAAGTTVPSLRRRYRSKPDLAAAVIDSLRVEELPDDAAEPRELALAVLENFQRNLGRPRAIATLGSLLAEEHREPGLLGRFRRRLVKPRRALLQRALAQGVGTGELPADLDVEAAANLLIGSFYARYVSGDPIPRDWARRVLLIVWPRTQQHKQK